MNVRLRRVGKRDLKALNNIINEREVCRFLSVNYPVSLASTRRAYDRFKSEGWLWYAVLVDGVVGGGVLLKPQPKNTKMSHVASLGINLAKKFWGMGAGEKALRSVISDARRMGFKRLELEYVRGNIRAKRLYEKMGFKKEGVRRKAFKQGNNYADSVCMGRWLG
jgi:RimJ/RimL family protein N-acetyltransferase